jgi:hypothetical protein
MPAVERSAAATFVFRACSPDGGGIAAARTGLDYVLLATERIKSHFGHQHGSAVV